MNWILLIIMKYLLFTLATEGIFLMCLGFRSRLEVEIVALANILTNPVVCMLSILAQLFAGGMEIWQLVVLEAGVWYLEGWIYRQYFPEKKHPWRSSAAANAISFLGGQLFL